MAAPSALQALHNVGKLSAALEGQTYNFTTAYPHGGTALGLVRDIKLQRTEGRELIIAEEFGVEVVDEVYTGEAWLLAFALRGFDDDALGAIFPNTATGTLAKKKGIVYPGTDVVPGNLRSGGAVKVLFTPDDTANHHAVYLPNAIPEIAEELEIPLGRSNELLVLCGFRALRDAATAGRAIQVQLLEDLTA